MLIAVSLVWLASAPVWAADNKVENKAENKAETAEAAEAAAAMARAKRQAANPLKAILDASKMKRKAAEPDLAVVRSSGASGGTPAGGTPASVTTGTGTGTGASPTPVTNAGTGATATVIAATATAKATAALSSASPGNSTLLTRAPATSEALPTLTSAERIVPASALPSAVAPTAAVARGWIQPKLVDMVEPAIPARLLDEIGQLVELQADLSLRADGSVAAVNLVQPVPRQLVRYVTAALERWRFAPLPADQVHRVQLLFNDR